MVNSQASSALTTPRRQSAGKAAGLDPAVSTAGGAKNAAARYLNSMAMNSKRTRNQDMKARTTYGFQTLSTGPAQDDASSKNIFSSQTNLPRKKDSVGPVAAALKKTVSTKHYASKQNNFKGSG